MIPEGVECSVMIKALFGLATFWKELIKPWKILD